MENSASFYLTSSNLSKIISALEDGSPEVEVSPDLNLTSVTIPLSSRQITLSKRNFSLVQLKEMAQSLSGIILIQAESVEKLEFFADHYYKLRPTAFAPTLEIDGIRMHRTQNIDPFEDARRKVQWVIKPDDLVLDTCGGLGYTAIWALKLGARKVISIEINPHIIKLRALNPHSRSLFDENIELIVGDALNLINGFKPGQFDSIIHDPPRFSLAGELYSQEFYLRLNKILASSGRLFHYTGEPFSKGRGRKFIAGVLKRLQYSGFEARYIHADRGIFAQKN